ncbi:MAG: hypothetical protein JWM28_1559 [Chitinophagaceae bacterium]|nr:hypothetical protein [Chitinophagaceae bacterium]
MDNLDYMDSYFNSEASLAKKVEFEKKIAEDPAFAEELAFYLSVKQLAREQSEEKKKRFKELYEQYKQEGHSTRQITLVRKFWPYLAAAAIIAGIFFGMHVFFKPASPQQLADKYVQEHFQTLGVTMGDKEDSLQAGLRWYNEGRLNEALVQFESIANRDASSFEAKKYLGIVYLRLEQYDKAISCFLQLEKYTQLYANPGKLYLALTLLKRNQPGDKQQAKDLLQQVLQFDLEGKETAKQLLNKW